MIKQLTLNCKITLLQRDTSNIISFGGKLLNTSKSAMTTTTSSPTIATATRLTVKETGLQPYIKQKFRESRFSKLTRGLRKSAVYAISIAR